MESTMLEEFFEFQKFKKMMAVHVGTADGDAEEDVVVPCVVDEVNNAASRKCVGLRRSRGGAYIPRGCVWGSKVSVGVQKKKRVCRRCTNRNRTQKGYCEMKFMSGDAGKTVVVRKCGLCKKDGDVRSAGLCVRCLVVCARDGKFESEKQDRASIRDEAAEVAASAMEGRDSVYLECHRQYLKTLDVECWCSCLCLKCRGV